jgi:DNA modification methylase
VREFRVIQGDALESLSALAECSFDACLCDPPYGLEFMGKEWDAPWKQSDVSRALRGATSGLPVGVGSGRGTSPTAGRPGFDLSPRASLGFQKWCEEWARAVYRVLKPGAFLLAFGGTRTHHRLMCAIEDAGFEIRDCMMWLYGSGFPKSLDISKALDKRVGAENVIGTKPDRWTGKGSSLNFATDRPQTECKITTPATPEAARWNGYGTALKPAWEPVIVAMKPCDGTFAENALKWGVAGIAVDAGRIGTSESLNGGAYAQHGSDRHDGVGNWRYRRNGDAGEFQQPTGRWPANVILDEEVGRLLDEQSGELRAGNHPAVRSTSHFGTTVAMRGERASTDAGGASRFFYTAKADTAERNIGGVKNTHPTVKPVDLCAYLAKLLLPPQRETPRRLLVPFSGSGSEIMGALRAGWDEVTGIERDAEYISIARRRIEGDAPLFNAEAAPPPAGPIQEALL